MKRSGWNPTRRNRNIGTAKAGHRLANRLVVPSSWNDPRVYWEKLRDPVRVEADGFTLLVEPCSRGFVHAVTVDDALRVLGLLPSEDVARIRTLAFRQPTRKQRILSCVWGRLAYFANFSGTEAPAVILEAQRPESQTRWPRSLGSDDADELERLRQDGHEIVGDRRYWIVRSRLDAVRATQLFRTLPHEVGHYVQYDREVRQRAAGSPGELVRLQTAYFTKPPREREDFAHRYAHAFVDRWTRARRLPFDRLVDRSRIKRQGLEPAWFGVGVG